MPVVTTTTLTIPDAALIAAEKLVAAKHALNAASGGFAWSGDVTPYGLAEHALLVTVAHFIDGDLSDLRAATFGTFVADQTVENGESVEYQITSVLGWNLVLTNEDGESRTVEAQQPGPSWNVPSMLGGDNGTYTPNRRAFPDAL